jgi:hypothetical protein
MKEEFTILQHMHEGSALDLHDVVRQLLQPHSLKKRKPIANGQGESYISYVNILPQI